MREPARPCGWRGGSQLGCGHRGGQWVWGSGLSLGRGWRTPRSPGMGTQIRHRWAGDPSRGPQLLDAGLGLSQGPCTPWVVSHCPLAQEVTHSVPGSLALAHTVIWTPKVLPRCWQGQQLRPFPSPGGFRLFLSGVQGAVAPGPLSPRPGPPRSVLGLAGGAGGWTPSLTLNPLPTPLLSYSELSSLSCPGWAPASILLPQAQASISILTLPWGLQGAEPRRGSLGPLPPSPLTLPCGLQCSAPCCCWEPEPRRTRVSQ